MCYASIITKTLLPLEKLLLALSMEYHALHLPSNLGVHSRNSLKFSCIKKVPCPGISAWRLNYRVRRRIKVIERSVKPTLIVLSCPPSSGDDGDGDHAFTNFFAASPCRHSSSESNCVTLFCLFAAKRSLGLGRSLACFSALFPRRCK